MSEVVQPGASMPDLDGAIGLDWAEVHADPGEFGGTIVLGPAGWIHDLYVDNGSPVARFELSADLTTWRDIKPTGKFAECTFPSLAATQTAYFGACGNLWRSVDGISWKAITATIEGGEPPDGLADLASDGSILLGWAGGYPASDGVWTSSDGATWSKVRLPGGPHLLVDAVTARPTGGFMVSGRVAATAEELDEAAGDWPPFSTLPGRQALWTTDDGSSWTNLDIGDAFDGARIIGLALDGPGGGVVATGIIGSDSREVESTRVAALWRSVDLRSWQHLVGPQIDMAALEPDTMHVVATPARWILLAEPEGVNAIAVVAGSEDGGSWWATDPIRLEASGASYSIVDVVRTKDQLVVLGELISPHAGDRPGARIWLSPPASD